MNSFDKAERITHKTLFEELFNSGQSFIKYPFRIVFKESSLQGVFPARMAISVSKKKFKSAVKRNRIKRQVRESFRLNKYILSGYLQEDKTYDILFIYLDEHLPASYAKLEKAVKNVLEQVVLLTNKEEKNGQ